ncbi:30S ribosomal protein S2 [Anaerolineaceae bacterium oral taxon 439]|nr:30S ribosomal protein S2 [Anaerolineaceae bacterium oral taxon 439]
MSNVISMKALLESGVHFGHRTNKWNPAMKPYIFTERNGIHILDLQQTAKSINTAYALVRDTVKSGQNVLFVGTKRQAQETIKDEAMRCGMPYVTERWLGGTLTNWDTISSRIGELDRLEKLVSSGEVNKLTKKEGLLIEREIQRLNLRLGGLRTIHSIPGMLIVVDVMREDTAIHEANLTGIPVVALVDTNCDPGNVDYVIPSNDDAIRAIKLIIGRLADAVIEGKALRDEGDMGDFGFAPSAAYEKESFMSGEELAEEDLLSDNLLAKISEKKTSEESDESEGEE